MNSPWSIAFIATPSIVGALLSSGVDLYAELAPSVAETALSATPRGELGRHDIELASFEQLDLSGTHATIAPAAQARYESVHAVQHDGHTYLALKTRALEEQGAHTHVLSSVDGRTWRWEHGLSRTAEMYGPRLLSHAGHLMAYVSVESAGTEGGSATLMAERRADGSWSDFERIELDGRIVSAVRTVQGIPLMTAYVGGTDVYRSGLAPREIQLLTTQDGRSWHPPSAGRHAVYQGGGSDAVFSSGQDGNLLAVVRNETGDDSGWGTSVCIAATGEWSTWDCVNDPKSYGAATTFNHDGETYLVGERQLSGDGRYDVGTFSGALRLVQNQAEQLTTGKRCALWRYEPSKREFTFVEDLPSRGASCTPTVVAGAQDGQFWIYSQTSDLAGPDWTSYAAKSAPSQLYRYEVRLQSRAGTLNVTARDATR